MATPKDLPRDIGGFIRDLRHSARISLRQLAEQAGVSNPYLSQVERGLRKPSAEVLQQLASALRVSTPVMYLRAGLLDDKDGQGVLASIAADTELTMAQKQSLSQIYETFRRENSRHAEPDTSTQAGSDDKAGPDDKAGSDDKAGPETGPEAAAARAEEQTLQSVAVTEAGAAPAPATEKQPAEAPKKTTPRRRTPRAGTTDQAAATATEEKS
ncbi:helix-turn-helix domain-containing protein [Micromonospora sp. NBC_01813]|uniref:helix-turn-helix domain-containing protein n=1 Tax=Micromonospora sp. NBC_01813 TaxID=2975988 RepID=UPI002DDB6C56|nr:helix-turn-helix domain-containing protein [Micromonospora sp. NBC_01813]WSA06516.1 helix-turn-helix domain-containing protein [Micromonospora sp. NBC_01813]